RQSDPAQADPTPIPILASAAPPCSPPFQASSSRHVHFPVPILGFRSATTPPPPSVTMKGVFDEISDEEWENHTFVASRVLKKRDSPLPSIESFAYRSTKCQRPEEQSGVRPRESTAIVHDEEDGNDEVTVVRSVQGGRSRTRRFVVDEGSEEENLPEVVEVRSTEDEGEFVDGELGDEEQFVDGELEDEEQFVDGELEDEVEEELGKQEEVDLVRKALQKCAKISATLRQELYGSAASCCERYAEVDASAARIVTQEDIDAVCPSQETGFEPTLKPYQLVGVNFLLLLYRKNIGGGEKYFTVHSRFLCFLVLLSNIMMVLCTAILADEMGLGKTVQISICLTGLLLFQAVTYLNLLNHLDNDPGPHLIVCPASLLENWERELRRWCPSFSVVLFHGAARTTYSRELNSMGKAGLPPPFNVLVTCYSLFERRTAQQKDDRKVLRHWQWSCVLMDEAHALKDKSSSRWRSLMSIAKNARQRLMLTGTPLQNDLHELWSLLEFMMPDIFANEDADFKKQLNADDNDLIVRIKSILGPFVLRRLKSDVMQQLSAKIQQVEYVPMEVEQAEAYKEAICDYRAFSQARTIKSLDATSSKNVSSLPKRQMSNYFMQFRKIANHPLLVRRIYKDGDVLHFAKMLYSKGAFGFECNLERAIQELQSYNDFEIH
ncbi:hypothetical protein Taro_032078, partial [Colocasia esculenta]|nr:hypothetical protein [Colocasia esculenta]